MTLRIFVQVWCEIDPTLNVRIERATATPVVEPGDQLWRVSPLGRTAVASALGLDASVTAFALGSGHADALRHALAAGAARAVELRGEGAGPSLAALADWLRGQAPDLVIGDRLVGRLAARLGWAHLAGLDELSIEQGTLRAVRHLGRGDREVVRARLPAAVRLQSEAVHPRYVSRSRLQAAADLTIEQHVLCHDLATGADGLLQAARPRTRRSQTTSTPTASSASDRLQALIGAASSPTPHPTRTSAGGPVGEPTAPAQLAEEFVRYLLHHDLLPNHEHAPSERESVHT